MSKWSEEFQNNFLNIRKLKDTTESIKNENVLIKERKSISKELKKVLK